VHHGLPRLAALAIGAALIVLRAAPAAQSGPRALPTIVVTNGDAAVAEAIVSLTLPPTLVGESFIVRASEDGDAVVTQLLRDRTLAFAVHDLAPREVRRLRLEPALDRRVSGPIVARDHFDGVELSIEGQPVASYRTQPSVSLADDLSPVAGRGVGRGGYLHPLRTPAGAVVTDDDAPGRPEQRGLWSAWGATRVNGRWPDFWRTGTGAVEFEGVLGTWSGPVVAGFRARHRAIDRMVRPPLTAETETWQVTVPALGRVGRRHRVIDLAIAHENVLSQPIVVAAAAYGGLGLRGPRAWIGATGMAVLTSDGRTRRTASRSRVRWVAMVGLVGGANAGIAILDHPDNVRHPSPLYVDAGQPFVGLAPTQIGPLTLQPDRELLLRYRIVTFDGFPDRAWLERLWQAYAQPPRATLVLAR
jgi:methane monooxygenase PmoA-like